MLRVAYDSLRPHMQYAVFNHEKTLTAFSSQVGVKSSLPYTIFFSPKEKSLKSHLGQNLFLGRSECLSGGYTPAGRR